MLTLSSRYHYTLIVLLLVVAPFWVSAQGNSPSNDSLKLQEDALVHKRLKNKPDPTHDPSKAMFRSAVLPGWGQVYNHKVWKVPIVYGLLGVLGQQVVSNRSNYRHYLKVYRYFRDPLGTEVNAKEYATYLRLQRTGNGMAYADALQSNYQRNMQLSILGLVGIWGIQVVDAYIDAKMIHSYSIGTDLSFNLLPGVITTADQYAGLANAVTPVIQARLNF